MSFDRRAAFSIEFAREVPLGLQGIENCIAQQEHD